VPGMGHLLALSSTVAASLACLIAAVVSDPGRRACSLSKLSILTAHSKTTSLACLIAVMLSDNSTPHDAFVGTAQPDQHAPVPRLQPRCKRAA